MILLSSKGIPARQPFKPVAGLGLSPQPTHLPPATGALPDASDRCTPDGANIDPVSAGLRLDLEPLRQARNRSSGSDYWRFRAHAPRRADPDQRRMLRNLSDASR